MKISEILSSTGLKSSKLFDLYKSIPQKKINLAIKNELNNRLNNKINRIIKKYNTNSKNLRILIRKSGTEPLIRILVEGKISENVANISKTLDKEIKKILNDK